jgi:hypothetical protein
MFVRLRNALFTLGPAAVLLAVWVPAMTAPALAAEDLVFRLEDPRDDDHGDGTIRYPLSYYDLRPGALDLVAVEVRNEGDEVVFEVGFARNVVKTDRRTIDIGGGNLDDLARFDFFQQNVDIYIDTDRQSGSGGLNALPGRKANLAPETAWERAVVLTPRPFDARTAIERLLLRELRQELDRGELPPEDTARLKESIPTDVARHIFFPNKIRVRGSKIIFSVPQEFLGGPAQASWSYVIFSSGAQIDQRFDFSADVNFARQQSLFILPVAPGGAQERFGGARDDDYQQPPILDLIVAPGTSQKQVLSNYDPYRKRPVVLPGVVPAELQKPAP